MLVHHAAEAIKHWLPPTAIVGIVMGVQTWQFRATTDLQQRAIALEVRLADDRARASNYEHSVQRELDELGRKLDRITDHILKEKP